MIYEHLLYDPQTSGGLLIAVPEKNANHLLLELENGGDIYSRIVGEVSDETDEIKAGMLIFDYV